MTRMIRFSLLGGSKVIRWIIACGGRSSLGTRLVTVPSHHSWSPGGGWHTGPVACPESAQWWGLASWTARQIPPAPGTPGRLPGSLWRNSNGTEDTVVTALIHWTCCSYSIDSLNILQLQHWFTEELKVLSDTRRGSEWKWWTNTNSVYTIYWVPYTCSLPSCTLCIYTCTWHMHGFLPNILSVT